MRLYNIIIRLHDNLIDKCMSNQTKEWKEHYKIGGTK